MHEPATISSASNPGETVAEVSGLGVRRAGRWLVRGVDLSVHRGEIVTLIGPNGSGKTTTAKALLGQVRPNEGKVAVKPGIRLGYVPQRLAIDGTLPLTMGRLLTLTQSHAPGEVGSAAERTGVAGLLDRDVNSLSGGEFQRALLARAILRKPDLLILDEPVQGVDFAGEIALYDLIRQIRDELNCGVLLISHDLHFVMAQTDTVICLNGHVCCSGTPLAVSANPEYRKLFGSKAAEAIAVYRHDHDHHHGPDGCVIPHDDHGGTKGTGHA